MAVFGAIVIGTVNELFGFMTLSLLLQVGITSRFIGPYLVAATAASETQIVYALLGLYFIFTFYVVPSIVAIMKTFKDANAVQRLYQFLTYLDNQLPQDSIYAKFGEAP